jgi:hypothetical protein
VDCIHWVDREQLPALEYVMQKRMGRTNVGVMMSGQGASNGDVFELAIRFLKLREARCGGCAALLCEPCVLELALGPLQKLSVLRWASKMCVLE